MYRLSWPVADGEYWQFDIGDVGSVRAINGARITSSTGADGPDDALQVLAPTGSVWEYAHTFTPEGGSQAVFIGNGHDYDTEESLTITVDGELVDLDDGQTVTGDTIVVTRLSVLSHPEAEHVGDVTFTYTLDSDGLTTDQQIDWAIAGQVSVGYPAMLPVDGDLSMCATAGATPANAIVDNGATLVSSQSSTAWLWEPSGSYAVIMASLDVDEATGDWEHTGSKGMWVQDRSGETTNKAYLTRVASDADPEAVTASDVWRSRTLYRAAKFPNANAALYDT